MYVTEQEVRAVLTYQPSSPPFARLSSTTPPASSNSLHAPSFVPATRTTTATAGSP